MADEKIIAYCGIRCDECPAFVATRTGDESLLAKTAAEWSSEDHPLKPEDVICDGCGAGGRLFHFCSDCEVRSCAIPKAVANCAYCAEYSCDTLEGIWNKYGIADARKTLDEVKRTSSG